MVKFPYSGKILSNILSDFFISTNNQQPITVEDCIYSRDYTKMFLHKLLLSLKKKKINISSLKIKNINYIVSLVNFKFLNRFLWFSQKKINYSPNRLSSISFNKKKIYNNINRLGNNNLLGFDKYFYIKKQKFNNTALIYNKNSTNLYTENKINSHLLNQNVDNIILNKESQLELRSQD